MAQTPPPPAPPPVDQGAAADLSGIKEVVVTATRRSEALSKVPESITAFTAEKMEIEGIKTFADVAKFTPGVRFDENRHDVSIRGVTSEAGSGTTGIYIDDTPIQVRALGLNANNTLPAVFDLDRVEVLRGPQGTLFGAGSEGGTVRYITPQPSLTDYSATVHSELAGTEGGDLSYETGVEVGGPVIDNVLGLRLSGWARRDGGWIDKYDSNTGDLTEKNANSTNTYVVRAALAYVPIENLTITPSYNFEQHTQNNYNSYFVGLSDRGAGKFYDATPEFMTDPDRFHLGSLKVEYDFDDVVVIANTSFYDRSERLNGYSGTLYDLSYFQQIINNGTDPQLIACTNNCGSKYPLLTPTGINLPGFGPYIAKNWITNTQQNFTQEVRAQSADPNDPLTWTTGVFFAYNKQRSIEEINDPQLPALTEYLWNEQMIPAWGENLLPNGDDYITNTQAHDRQVAVFGDATYAILDNLKVTAGLRYAWTHFDYMNLGDGPQDLLDNGGVPAITSGGKNEKPLTPKFGATYQITPDDMVYTTIAKGYRIGGATPPLPAVACGGTFPTSYNSDSTWSYEVGSKDKAFDRTLQISGSAYFIQWKNIQQAIYVPQCGIQYTTNVGNAVSEGFDIEADWAPTEHFTFNAAIGYTDAKFSTDAIDPTTGVVLARKGDALNVVPWTVTLGGQYDFVVDNQDAFFRADYEFASRRHRQLAAEDATTGYYDAGLVPDPATQQVSMRTGITLSKVLVELFVENLLNSHPQLSLAHEDKYTQLYTAETFRPRTIGLAVTYKY